MKRSFSTTLQLIADLLSFGDNQEALANHLSSHMIDWDAVVIVASKHLMLPALYCRLKAKELLPLIPEDLNLYLEDIATINRGRNKILLEEALEVSKILEKEHIEHIFIKGVALLAGNAFNDPAERMVGDIDILVAPDQIHRAFDLLTDLGYSDTVTSIISRKNHRHLPRQVSEQQYGAIELHNEVLIHKHKHLINSKHLLENRQMVNGIAVPSKEDAIKIAILGLQINDRAHFVGFLNFKSIYDCLALGLQNRPDLIESLSQQKHAQSFLALASVFFKELKPYQLSHYSNFLKRYFVFKIQHPKLGGLASSVLKIKRHIQIRIGLLLHNESYRKHVLNNKLK
ncbi:nucleotidyltransferase family protein [Gelidibacter sp.]|uniref:nucleotidyltransferase family protein n=1 Tax=Gelidibacter sp. TaxID=2018083 RepID=UPI002B95B74B|nr:nucleotidyltransferase family protein [Gelidibacter sp.]HUH29185.1 nucleotidyltransferase family protein [Gelidibacter sp.]